MRNHRAETARERVTMRRSARQADRRGMSMAWQRVRFLLSMLLWFALVLIITIAFGAIAADQYYRGRILPNVSVQGFSLGGLSREEARRVLIQYYGTFVASPITFADGERVWQPLAADIGVRVEIEDAISAALAAGRRTDFIEQLRESFAVIRFGKDLPLRITLDQRRLQAYLTNLAPSLDRAAQSAGIMVVKAQVLSTPAREGRQLLVDATVRDATAGLAALQPYTVTLQTRTLPPTLADANVMEAAHQLAVLLGGSLRITAGERAWEWSPEDIATLVRLEQTITADGARRIVPMLDRDALTTRIEAVASDVTRSPIEPRLRFTSAGVKIAIPGQPGVTLDVDAAADTISAALWQGARKVSLPLATVEPQIRVETIADLGISELVAQGRSDFRGSAPYRVTNIIAGARQMDGVLIPPDGEFSFNQSVGAIDETNGFTRGYAIIDGRTQLEWGGGVCQVSTTVFRAAYWAGLPITERNQHSFRINWYEVYEPIGMDAAIFTGPGGYDLRFVNDTGRWLLMQTEVDTDRSLLVVNLYGSKPDREVIQVPVEVSQLVPAPNRPRYIDDPSLPPGSIKQTDTARDGMDVRVGRIVRTGERVLRTDIFFSRYQPWPDVFVRGTGS